LESSAAPEQGLDQYIVEAILRDAKKALTALNTFMEKGKPYSEEELRMYTVRTHGMRSAFANTGKTELSAIALRLETLGRDKNVEAITAETPAFLTSLRGFIEELEEKNGNREADNAEDDKPFLREKLLMIKAACEAYNETAADEALKALLSKKWSPPVKKLLAEISEKLLHSDFDEAASAVYEYAVNL
jgi:hypothetical protein